MMVFSVPQVLLEHRESLDRLGLQVRSVRLVLLDHRELPVYKARKEKLECQGQQEHKELQDFKVLQESQVFKELRGQSGQEDLKAKPVQRAVMDLWDQQVPKDFKVLLELREHKELLAQPGQQESPESLENGDQPV